MRSKKMMCCASIVMLVSAISLTGQAADNPLDKSTDVATQTTDVAQPNQDTKTPKKTKKAKGKTVKEQPKVQAKVPIAIEADKLSYSDLTGDVFADGHVSVVQNPNKILTDFLRGNNKQTEFWIDGKADFFQPGTKLTGIKTHYNYTDHTGTMHSASGIVDKQHVSGQAIDILPTEMIVHNGTTTNCPAIVPDYHISADRMEIWPDDKMIAYNAKFWIGKMVLFSLPKYQVSLKKGAAGAEDAFPRIGYSSNDGVTVKQNFEFPITDHVAAFTDLVYYSKFGFKPQYGIVDREKNFVVNLLEGEFRDTDDHWVKKEPELNFNLYSHRLAKLPVSYTFSAVYGKWSDSTKSSWHQAYNLYFTRDTINLSKSLFLGIGTGVGQVRESYNNSVQNSLTFNTTLTKVLTPKITTWATYNYTQNTSTLFDYNSTALGQELINGISYKIDQKNSVAYSQSYNLQGKQLYSRTYTWNRDLHCWQGVFSYTTYAKSAGLANKLTWDFSMTRW